jgi:hypothetical protein
MVMPRWFVRSLLAGVRSAGSVLLALLPLGFLAAILLQDAVSPSWAAAQVAPSGAGSTGGTAAQPTPPPATPWIPPELAIELKVKAAFNGEMVFWLFEWPAPSPRFFHDVLLYQDGEWVARGDSGDGADALGLREDRIAFMIDAGEVPGFANQGCYVACHAGLPSMRDEVDADAIAAALGPGWGHSDLTKYIPASRRGDLWWEAPWDRVKSPEELAALARSGVLLELWHWRSGRSNPIHYSDDQYVLEYRTNDGPVAPFATNWDAAESRPQVMYDSAALGFHALRWDRLQRGDYGQDSLYALVADRAVPFDPDRPWQDGDVIPRRILRTPGGSEADILADGRWQDGSWRVQLQRAMDTGNPTTDHTLLEGRTYHVAFAVHRDATSKRWHLVSLPVHVGLGVPADITAPRFEGALPDWGTIPWSTVSLYYPAQVNWEWLTSDAHPGAPGIRADDRSCRSCHGGDPGSALKLSQASVHHEVRGDGPRVDGPLTLLAVLSLLVGGTLASMRLARRPGRREGP